MDVPFLVGALLLLVPFATLALYAAVSFEFIGANALGRNGWRALVLMSLAAIVAAQFLFAQSAAPQAAANAAGDKWAAWRAELSRHLQACTPKPDVDCLAASLDQAAEPGADIAQGIAGRLFDHFRLANQLMLVPEARDILWKGFGIDDKTFMGTGYSLPEAQFATLNYGGAGQREYFVPNLCADAVDVKVCPNEDANVWTWQLSAADVKKWLARPIGDLLQGAAPKDHADEFKRISSNWASQPNANGASVSPGAFIRFAHFKPQFYAGTLGRPGAKLVFAAGLNQVWGTSLSDAMRNTGAAGLDEGIPDDQVLFVWLYVNEAPGQVPPATWSAVFDALKAKP